MSLSLIIVSVLVVVAVVVLALTCVAVFRAPDALSRGNVLSVSTGVALPLLIGAKLLHSWVTVGFSVYDLVVALLAITGLLVVTSVASFTMGRSIYGVSVADARIRARAAQDADAADSSHGAQPQQRPQSPIDTTKVRPNPPTKEELKAKKKAKKGGDRTAAEIAAAKARKAKKKKKQEN